MSSLTKNIDIILRAQSLNHQIRPGQGLFYFGHLFTGCNYFTYYDVNCVTFNAANMAPKFSTSLDLIRAIVVCLQISNKVDDAEDETYFEDLWNVGEALACFYRSRKTLRRRGINKD